MIIYNGEKMTINKAAKLMVADKGALAEYYAEDYSLEIDKLTEREEIKLAEAIQKQIARVEKFLGV